MASSTSTASRVRLRRLAPPAAVIAVLAASLALAHGELFRAGAARFVALAPSGSLESMHPLRSADVTFEAWLASRHARTLLREPWRLFDTPHCAPGERTLTLGVPAIALGLLGIPAALFSSEPLLVYNWARVTANLVCALAMYCLVRGWSGRRAAGLAAALLFAFHSIRVDLSSHPPEWDLAWTVLGLFFAERLAAGGRWRDAAGLALCGALQIAASFYALLASALLGLPFGAWLLLRREPRRATPMQLAFVAGFVALSAVLLLGPYLAARSAGQIGGRTFFFYASWQDYGPGGRMFPGAALLLSALIGMLLPRRFVLRGVAGDPRPALVGAAALAAFLAGGPSTARSLQGWGIPLPAFDPYAALARILPGLDSIRDVSLLGTTVYLVACLLAGLCFGAVLDAARRFEVAVSAALVALAALVCFGSGPRHWLLAVARPKRAAIEFYQQLARLGNDGPLLELPFESVGGDAPGVDAQRVLLSAWHRRRTSACFGSFPVPGHERLAALVSSLPEREAVAALRTLGFTTLVTHHPARIGARLEQPYERASRGPDATLRRLLRIETATAYELVAQDEAR